MRSSSSSCSATESTSYKVDTWCCASTSRQQVPASACESDDSAAGVQVLDDIHQSGNGLDKGERLRIERGVSVLEPGARNHIITAKTESAGTNPLLSTDDTTSGTRRLTPSPGSLLSWT